MDIVMRVLEFRIWGNAVLAYLVFLGFVIGGWIVGYVANAIIKGKLKKFAENSETKIDDLVVGVIGGPVVLLVFIFGMSLGAKSLSGGFAALVQQIYSTLVYVAAAWIIFRTLDGVTELYVKPLLAKTETKVDDVLVPLVLRAIKVVVAVFVVLLALQSFGYGVGPITSSLLQFGLLLCAAAAFSTIWLFRSVASGLVVLFNRPFSEGDTIGVQGVVYTVEKIEIHQCILVDETGVRTAIPNHDLVTAPIRLIKVTPAPKKF